MPWRCPTCCREGNPARYAARIVIPASASMPVRGSSPRLPSSTSGRRDRRLVVPIKGTAAPGEPMLDKDEAENVMITDLIRNDLSHVAVPGTVAVPELLGVHEHPGLVAPPVDGDRAARARLRLDGRHVGGAVRRDLPSGLRERRAQGVGAADHRERGASRRAARIAARSAGSTPIRGQRNSPSAFAPFGGTTRREVPCVLARERASRGDLSLRRSGKRRSSRRVG